MANPQKENGHIDIANEIAEALAKVQLSGYENRILWVILRKTYGWHKKEDSISITQFEKATRLKRRHIHRTLKQLIEKNIITKNGNGFIIKYGLQKDYEKWQTITKNGNIPKMVTRFVTKNGAHKRKLTKETIYSCEEKTPHDSIPSSEKQKTHHQEIEEIFKYWQIILHHPQAKLTNDRKIKIGARFKEGYSVEQLKKAIDGCKASSYHMGENDKGKVFDSIGLIFRNADKMEELWGYLDKKPKYHDTLKEL